MTEPRRAVRAAKASKRFAGPAVVAASLVATSGLIVLAPTAAAGEYSVKALSTTAKVDHSAVREARADRDARRAGEVVAVKAPVSSPMGIDPDVVRAAGSMFALTDLNVRGTASAKSTVLGTIPAGTKVALGQLTLNGLRQVSFKGHAGWVNPKSLSKTKPTAEQVAKASGGTTMAACRLGAAVESGLQPKTVLLYRSVCALFPKIKDYGGVRPDSMPYHPSGRALDIMLPTIGDPIGDTIAAYVIAHASEFNVDHVIYRQRIWLPGMGWRGMEDRGSATANHYDHVHVTIKG